MSVTPAFVDVETEVLYASHRAGSVQRSSCAVRDNAKLSIINPSRDGMDVHPEHGCRENRYLRPLHQNKDTRKNAKTSARMSGSPSYSFRVLFDSAMMRQCQALGRCTVALSLSETSNDSPRVVVRHVIDQRSLCGNDNHAVSFTAKNVRP